MVFFKDKGNLRKVKTEGNTGERRKFIKGKLKSTMGTMRATMKEDEGRK